MFAPCPTCSTATQSPTRISRWSVTTRVVEPPGISTVMDTPLRSPPAAAPVAPPRAAPAIAVPGREPPPPRIKPSVPPMSAPCAAVEFSVTGSTLRTVPWSTVALCPTRGAVASQPTIVVSAIAATARIVLSSIGIGDPRGRRFLLAQASAGRGASIQEHAACPPEEERPEDFLVSPGGKRDQRAADHTDTEDGTGGSPGVRVHFPVGIGICAVGSFVDRLHQRHETFPQRLG